MTRTLVFLTASLLIVSLAASSALGAQYRNNTPGNKAGGDINPGDSTTFVFGNGVEFTITAQVFTKANLEIDQGLGPMQFGIVVKGTQPVELTIQGQQKGRDSQINPGDKISSPQSGKQYQYSYGMVVQVQSNLTNSETDTFSLQATLPEGRLAVNYHWAIFNASSGEYEILDTMISGQVVTADAASTSFEAILLEQVEELFPLRMWGLVVGAVVILVVLTAVFSKAEYRQWVIQRFTRRQAGIHRLSIEDVLENETRGKIVDYVLDHPGANFNEIRVAAGLQAGAATWHLELLLEYGILRRVESGQFHMYYPVYVKNPVSAEDLHLVKSATTLAILGCVAGHPGVDQDLLCHDVNKDVRTIRYHLQKLEGIGLITSEMDGKRKRYKVEDSARANGLLNHHVGEGAPNE